MDPDQPIYAGRPPSQAGEPAGGGRGRNREASRRLLAWRDAAAMQARRPDEPEDRQGRAIIEEVLHLINRLDGLSARYTIKTLTSPGRGVSLSIEIPETDDEAVRRNEAARDLLRSWREEGDEREQVETLRLLEEGLGEGHFPKESPSS